MKLRPLLLGIDPGTTMGYALVSLEGNVVDLGESKLLSLSDVIERSISRGHVILIGTDKAKIPETVRSCGANLGARVVAPPRDLTKEEKRSLVAGKETPGDHAKDALAAALFAVHSIESILRRIVAKEVPLEHRDAVATLVIEQGIPIESAMHLVLEPQLQEEIATAVAAGHVAPDYLRRVGLRFSQQEELISQLRRQLSSLREESRKLLRRIALLEKKGDIVQRQQQKEKQQQLLIASVHRMSVERDQERSRNKQLRKQYDELRSCAMHPEQWLIVPWVKNLCKVPLSEGIAWLVVDNPNEFREQDMVKLNALEGIITLVPPGKKIRELFAGVIVTDSTLALRSGEGFAMIAREELLKRVRSQVHLTDVIASYREDRKRLLGA